MLLWSIDQSTPFVAEKIVTLPVQLIYNRDPFLDEKQIIIMEQQNYGKRVLDSIERAKLGVKVFSMPFAEAEEVIDAYVCGGGYDPDSVELFKDQLDTQRHIQEKSVELLSTGAEIIRLVVNAIVKNIPQSSNGDGSHS
jgi:hypothetical protein